MELGRLLVAEERVRYPHLVPAVLAEPHLLELGAVRAERQTRVAPLLTQVHADGEVLREANTSRRKLHWVRSTSAKSKS